MICLSSTTVVFSADQVVVGCGVTSDFQTLDFSMPFVFAIALIDFLFSFSKYKYNKYKLSSDELYLSHTQLYRV